MEFASLWSAGGVVSLGINAGAAIFLRWLCQAITKSPAESIATVARYSQFVVYVLTWNSLPWAAPVELYALCVDSVGAAILAIALPGDHEIAHCVHGYGGLRLPKGCIGIDAELASSGLRRLNCIAGRKCRSRCHPACCFAR